VDPWGIGGESVEGTDARVAGWADRVLRRNDEEPHMIHPELAIAMSHLHAQDLRAEADEHRAAQRSLTSRRWWRWMRAATTAPELRACCEDLPTGAAAAH
jgi:hypothetical protein